MPQMTASTARRCTARAVGSGDVDGAAVWAAGEGGGEAFERQPVARVATDATAATCAKRRLEIPMVMSRSFLRHQLILLRVVLLTFDHLCRQFPRCLRSGFGRSLILCFQIDGYLSNRAAEGKGYAVAGVDG